MDQPISTRERPSAAAVKPSRRTLVLELCSTDAIGSSWHSQLAPGTADMGRLRIGPKGLIQRLATLLGSRFKPASAGERVASAARILAALDDDQRWFSATRAADPWGAAQWLVDAHDTLRSFGWDGRLLDGSPRLGALSALWRGVDGLTLPPGEVDGWHWLSARLAERKLPVSVEVRLQAPARAYAPALRAVLDALAAQGHSIVEPAAPRASAPEDSDLGRLQRALLTSNESARVDTDRVPFSGDGSVQILQGRGPWQAAALATATCDDAALWLVSGEGTLLELVRARFGRPRLGLSSASPWRPALQILPLALAMQFGPQNPRAALELLTLPINPIPKGVRYSLVRALADQSTVGSPAWQRALETALADHQKHYPDTDIDAVRTRIDTLLPTTPSSRATAAALAEVAGLIASWARARASMSAGERCSEAATLRAAGTVAQELARSLATLDPAQHLDFLESSQLCAFVAGSGVTLESKAEAGAPATAETVAVLPEELGALVWFGLVAGTAEVARGIPWSPVEVACMKTAGFAPPREGALRDEEQAGWSRAVLAAGHSVTLVTWTSAGGEDTEPHPLLDVLASRLTDGALATVTTRAGDFLADKANPAARNVPLSNPVTPRRTWRVPANLISTRRQPSATAIEHMITCPLRWTLRYAANLRPGATATLPELRTLAGTFSHELFARVLFEPATSAGAPVAPGSLPLEALEAPDAEAWAALTPQMAHQRMAAAFDAMLPRIAGPLTLPTNAAFKERLRRQLCESAKMLVQALDAGRWRPEAPEKDLGELDGSFAGRRTTGQIDLLVRRDDGSRAVIDFKLGSGKYKRQDLEGGTALQLAVYAKAASERGVAFPGAAYFILEDSELLTTNNDDFPGVKTLRCPADQPAGIADTARDAERAWRWWQAATQAGVVVARGEHLTAPIPDEALAAAAGAEPPVHPWAAKEVSCRFCDAQRLCQFTLDGGAA